jgi:methyl-accepting chemotaxis protein
MLDNTKISTKVVFGFVVALIVAALIGIVGYLSVTRIVTLMHDVSDNRMPSTNGVQEMVAGQNLVAAGQRGLVIRRMMEPKARQENYDAVSKGLRQLADGRRVYDSLPQAPEEQRLWQRLLPILDDWNRNVQSLTDLEREKDGLLARGAKATDPEVEKLDDRAFQALLQARDARVESARLLQEIVQLNVELTKRASSEAASLATTATTTLLAAFLVGALIVFVAGYLISRGIAKTLQQLTNESQRLVNAAIHGQLNSRGDVSSIPVEFQPIIQGMNDTLDAVIGPLNVSADYIEKIAKGDIPAKITATYYGDFNSIKNNLNTLIDTFNGFTAAMAHMSREHDAGDIDVFVPLDHFQGTYHLMAKGVNEMVMGHIAVKKKAMACIAQFAAGNFDAPLERFPGKKAFINQNIELLRSNCKALIIDANTLSQAAVEGRLGTRADASKHSGDFRRIVEGVNATLDSVIGPLNVAAEYVDKISKGTIPSPITDSYNGDFNTIKNNLNQCIEAIRLLVTDANSLSRAAVAGRLGTRADATRHFGDFRKIVQGVNDTLDSVIGPLNVAADYVDKISKGNIPPKIAEQYNGDFNAIKNNLNQCIDAVNLLVMDADTLARAAVEGKLATRADATKHQGDFRKIVQGVNSTLDAVIGPLNVAADYVDNISKGNIPARITDHYNGDFNALKNNLNQCIDAVNLLIADAQSLSEASIEGRLSTRADASKHNGDFRKIVEGVNRTLDAVITPVMEATQVLEALSQYDLRARMLGNYSGDHARIKTALNDSAKALHDALAQVAEAVEQVSEASTQIAASSQSVAQGASEQASSLEETSSSLEEMAGMTKQNADNTIQARTLAQSTKVAAEKGGQAMTRMVDAMAKIRAASEGTSEIIKDINEIAFQTNLLALNAAVEAARAGEAGRGFAVVAEEVRSLALRSKEAAKKTEDLIKLSVGHAENGRVISSEVAGSLTEIVSAAGKVNDIVSEIAVASQEQSRGIEQVNHAVSEMDKVVQVAAANAEESSSAAEELSSQSEELAGLVGRFQLEREATRRAAKRTASNAELRRRTPNAPIRRAPTPPQARPRTPGTGGPTASRKPSAEEAIPFETDPEFRDF